MYPFMFLKYLPNQQKIKDFNQFTNRRAREPFDEKLGLIYSFGCGSFNLIESSFLDNISDMVPKKEQIVVALENISKDTQNDITQLLMLSSINSITFDYWNDKKNRKFLGITIRA